MELKGFQFYLLKKLGPQFFEFGSSQNFECFSNWSIHKKLSHQLYQQTIEWKWTQLGRKKKLSYQFFWVLNLHKKWLNWVPCNQQTTCNKCARWRMEWLLLLYLVVQREGHQKSHFFGQISQREICHQQTQKARYFLDQNSIQFCSFRAPFFFKFCHFWGNK